MPRQRGVHRNRNDLAAQGNAILANKTYSVLLNTEKALKQNCIFTTVHLQLYIYKNIIRYEETVISQVKRKRMDAENALVYLHPLS